MHFRFSWRVTIICGLFMMGMIRLAFWQWSRHNQKLEYVQSLTSHLQSPISELNSIVQARKYDESLYFRRVHLKGQFDFEHEMILRNRRHESSPGVYVLTPLKLEGSKEFVIVNRGFIPLKYSEKEARKVFQRPLEGEFTGIIKETTSRRIFAPEDPPSGLNLPWVDAWLRVDLENFAKQLPYPILPFYIEVMSVEDASKAQDLIVSSKSDRDEMFFLAGKSFPTFPSPELTAEELTKFPIPTFSIVVPPSRHLGYVFEWSAMALMTFLIALILQLRRPKLPESIGENVAKETEPPPSQDAS